MQQLREMIAQLKADNERLRQEQTTSQASASITSPAPPVASSVPVAGTSASVAERLVVIPRERKCPMFNGKTGIGLEEWIEEIQACMRARHISEADKAFFIFDHLEGEAKKEIKYRPRVERGDPEKVLAILKELYGLSQSYVTLQQAFFSRQQQEGETLQEFSLALMALMEQVKQRAPDGVPNSVVLLRDQFVEHVLDNALRRELKQFVRSQPTATMLDMRGEAMRWEREGLPGSARARSFSLPSAYGLQYAVRGSPCSAPVAASEGSELDELKTMLKRQQEQLSQLTQTVVSLQASGFSARSHRNGPIICRRCHKPGHFAKDCDGERAPLHPRPNPPALPPGTSGPSQFTEQGN